MMIRSLVPIFGVIIVSGVYVEIIGFATPGFDGD